MSIQRCKNYQELSKTAADWLTGRLRKNPGSKIGAATGNSPLGMYRRIARARDLHTGSLSIFQLDEWVGLSEYRHSCRNYIENEVRIPWGVPEENIHYFSSDSSFLKSKARAVKAANSMQKELDRQGPLDLLILGMGKNGHLGFIEPGENWPPFECYVSTLAPSTQHHQMISPEERAPKYGVTMGIKSILEAKEILFLITGPGKSEVYAEWCKKVVTPKLPASILWKHPRVYTLTDL